MEKKYYLKGPGGYEVSYPEHEDDDIIETARDFIEEFKQDYPDLAPLIKDQTALEQHIAAIYDNYLYGGTHWVTYDMMEKDILRMIAGGYPNHHKPYGYK